MRAMLQARPRRSATLQDELSSNAHSIQRVAQAQLQAQMPMLFLMCQLWALLGAGTQQLSVKQPSDGQKPAYNLPAMPYMQGLLLSVSTLKDSDPTSDKTPLEGRSAARPLAPAMTCLREFQQRPCLPLWTCQTLHAEALELVFW